MTTKTIYFDESGFTGYDLLNVDQPIFVIASTDINPEHAKYILEKSFPKYQGEEFKFTNIWKNNKKGLETFCSQLKELDGYAFTWISHKKYTVLSLIVNNLIEPSSTAAGYDFYSDGFCWKYTNYILFTLNKFAPDALLDSILNYYQDFSRNPSKETLITLQTNFKNILDETPKQARYRPFIEVVSNGANSFEKYNDLENFKSTNEIHASSMLATVCHWRELYKEDFKIIHDESANFFRKKEVWEKITNHNVPEQQHRGGNGKDVTFPLRVTSTEFLNSKNNYSIQFCDILSGLVAKKFNPNNTKEDGEFLDILTNKGLNSISYDGIRPGNTFPDCIPPRKLKGHDIIDQMAEIIYGEHNNQ